MELLVLLRQLVAVVLDHRDGIGRTEQELGHRMTVHRTEVRGGLDLLLAGELLAREHEHAVLSQRVADLTRVGIADRRELHVGRRRRRSSWSGAWWSCGMASLESLIIVQ